MRCQTPRSIPAAATRTSTWCGPGSGRAISAVRSTSPVSPYTSWTTARMVAVPGRRAVARCSVFMIPPEGYALSGLRCKAYAYNVSSSRVEGRTPVPPTEAGPGRARLSRGRVLRAGIALADTGGLESLTMRRLGEELGVEAMSLYKHVANKDALIDGMVDLVFAEIELPDGGSDWRTAMRDRAVSARAALVRHPWATPLMQSRTAPGPATLTHHDIVIGTLRGAGFSVDLTAHAFSALDGYI